MFYWALVSQAPFKTLSRLAFWLSRAAFCAKHSRKLSRTELISQAFANCPELSQAFANEKFTQSFADLARLHVLLSRRHFTLTSLEIVTWEVLAAAHGDQKAMDFNSAAGYMLLN